MTLTAEIQSAIGKAVAFGRLLPGTQFLCLQANGEPTQVVRNGGFDGVAIYLKLETPGTWTVCHDNSITVAAGNYYKAVCIGTGAPGHFRNDAQVFPIALPAEKTAA